jgi:hypothetical protein
MQLYGCKGKQPLREEASQKLLVYASVYTFKEPWNMGRNKPRSVARGFVSSVARGLVSAVARGLVSSVARDLLSSVASVLVSAVVNMGRSKPRSIA